MLNVDELQNETKKKTKGKGGTALFIDLKPFCQVNKYISQCCILLCFRKGFMSLVRKKLVWFLGN